MKSYVLMGKKTGALMVGYRVTFLDHPANISICAMGDRGKSWVSGLMEHQGWVVEGTVLECNYFFNLKFADEYIEILGEL